MIAKGTEVRVADDAGYHKGETGKVVKHSEGGSGLPGGPFNHEVVIYGLEKSGTWPFSETELVPL